MTFDKKPYFMSDPSWYTYDESKKKYVLTPYAPYQALKSYDEFYQLLDDGTGDPEDNGEERAKKSLGL